eukprot:CAMPEP_0172375236 /NCGR_PEP_ID=MMETSP1060-20121228/60547_1 /TAXON_ID=37318 /ORGANISM="Pseudo-nitzschia pungens, Strain cf. cingulata" /LENGTH=196 /DNA_ID=CAMNT_0013102273 /DNA_START=89 /DNA_END=676 /DNA_ORIENTATION=-
MSATAESSNVVSDITPTISDSRKLESSTSTRVIKRNSGQASQESLPILRYQPVNNIRRKKRLSEKVKASVAKPARAVGRRVFRNRNSKIGILDSQGVEVVLNSDFRNKTSDDIFGNSPLVEEDATMNTSRRNNSGANKSEGRSMSRSLSQIMSQRPMSVNNETNTRDASGTVALVSGNVDDPDWPVRSVEVILRNV